MMPFRDVHEPAMCQAMHLAMVAAVVRSDAAYVCSPAVRFYSAALAFRARFCTEYTPRMSCGGQLSAGLQAIDKPQ